MHRFCAGQAGGRADGQAGVCSGQGAAEFLFAVQETAVMRVLALLPLPMMVMVMVMLVPPQAAPAFAESQTLPTDGGTLDVSISYDAIDPDTQARIKIDFINPVTQVIQEHIDYRVTVSKDGDTVFGPTSLVHTSTGSVRIPVEFSRGEGAYSMDVEVEGILFQPIPAEAASFGIAVGGDAAAGGPPGGQENGGCLIATAAFGSELAVQVQQLRELRDNTVLSTSSGTAFMAGFNQLYYSFSPAVADLQREHPAFREAVRVALTPMLSSLHLLNHAGIDSEAEMLGYGLAVLLLNAGMYVGVPAFGALKLWQAGKRTVLPAVKGRQGQ